MLEILKEIQANPHPHPHLGICGQLARETQIDQSTALWPRFRRWPLFSGSAAFPVPHPTMTPYEAFLDATDMGAMWADNEYGNNRRALLQYLIDELELLAILEQIPEDYFSPYGTCNFISGHQLYLVELFLNLAEHWPSHSGIRTCPVPSPDPDYTATEYYFHASRSNVWDKSTPYGQSRWALVEFVKDLLQ